MINKLNEIVNGVKNYPLVYISGAFRGKNGGTDIRDKEVKKNVKIAADLAKQLWEHEIGVLCPHMNTSMEFENAKDSQLFLDVDLKMQMFCDAIIMLPDWKKSKGAVREKDFAEKIGQPVYYSDYDCEDWFIYGTFLSKFKMILEDQINFYPNQFMAVRVLQAMSYFLHVNKNKDYSLREIEDFCNGRQ